MRMRTKIIASVVVAVVVCAFSFGLHIAKIQAGMRDGPLAQEITRLMATDSGLVFGALDKTIFEDYQWKKDGRAEFLGFFKTNLGLAGYGTGAKNVREWERVRRILKEKYEGGQVDTLLDGARSTLTPLPEGEGE